MKKIHLISKTHLDLGFTDYAENIITNYRQKFIPTAVDLANKLNKDYKKFVWTTGSWLIADSLKNASDENKEKLDEAIKKGYIVWHGLPFTTHTELLDTDTFRYGLDISKDLDEKYGKKTIAAKMTDVPGHTKAIIPLLQTYGIKLLHIGVNETSCLPLVPKAFLWKHNEAEIMVIYEGSYGNMYKNEYIDDILYFIHSNDNHGPSSVEQINAIYEKLKKDYPNYEICASTLDEYANELLKVKEKLPIIQSEIGDTWIHGIASDPFKTGALRELLKLKKQWLNNKELDTNSLEYKGFSDNLIQIAEHTWGMDVKRYFSDFNYLKKDFIASRKRDIVKTKLSFNNFYHKNLVLKFRKRGIYKEGSYKIMEKSWLEQRNYLNKGIACLPDSLQAEANAAVTKLLPIEGFNKSGYSKGQLNKEYLVADYNISFDSNGLTKLTCGNSVIMENTSELGTINYYSYGNNDYEYWRKNYMRNYKNTKKWSAPDFLRPGLKNVDKKYNKGLFPYTVTDILVGLDNKSFITLFSIDEKLVNNLGAPRKFEIKYVFLDDKVSIEVIWLNKDANRLPEAIFINFPIKIDDNSLSFTKLGQIINPYDIVQCGNRNLSSVEKINFEIGKIPYKIINIHSPLVSIGGGKILKFDNLFEDIKAKGVSYNLHNNIWGTNFPLWYEDNAYFKFIIQRA